MKEVINLLCLGWSDGDYASKQEVEVLALYGTVSSFFSAAIRLNIIGAIEAQRLISCVITELEEVLLKAPPSFPFSNALLSEIAVSRHRDSELVTFLKLKVQTHAAYPNRIRTLNYFLGSGACEKKKAKR